MFPQYIPTSKSRSSSSSSKAWIIKEISCFAFSSIEWKIFFSVRIQKWAIMKVKKNVKNSSLKPLVRRENGCFCILQKSLSNHCPMSYFQNRCVLCHQTGNECIQNLWALLPTDISHSGGLCDVSIPPSFMFSLFFKHFF